MPDRQQRPIVEFQFNSHGGEIFGKLTEEHIGDQLAIVLDDRVYRVPNIRSRIGARGQIEGRFSPQEAADLAVVLRSGSLPVPVAIEDERTVPGIQNESVVMLMGRWVGGLATDSEEPINQNAEPGRGIRHGGAHRGAGDTFTPSVAAAIGNRAFRVPLAFLFALGFDAPVLWIWLVILGDDVARAVWLAFSFGRER